LRQLTPTQARAILAQETAEVFLPCLKIEAGDTFRIVNNTEAIVRADGEYQPYPFNPQFPDDDDEQGSGVTITVDNIERDVSRMLRDYQGVPKATLELITADEPDSPVLGPCEFSILAADVDVMQVSLTLGHEEDFLNQRVPAQTYNPSNSQGLFL